MYRSILLAALLALTACIQSVFADGHAAAKAIEAAVAHPSRLQVDRDDDPKRKPAQVLEFFGIKPGMDVLDLFSGGGYYAEIMNHLVGPEGSVTAHSNSAYAGFIGAELLERRYGGGRLPNVTPLVAEANDLAFEPHSFDAILMIRTYHDIYYTPETGWVHIDGPKLIKEMYRALKPGGVLGVVDHAAAEGAPATTGNDLHRIDPIIVKKELTDAGFLFEAEAGFLHNHSDDLSKPMFADGIRGKTHRFVHRYRRPAQ